MNIKTLGLCGSPRRHGNTEQLLDRFLAGAKEEGSETEKVILSKLDYRSCMGCNACHKKENCVVKDDALELYTRILSEVDCLVVASPIYSMNMTAELKSLIDRAQYIWARKFIHKTLSFSEEHIMSHKGFFLSTAGMDSEDVFDAAFPTMRALFNNIGFEYCGNVLAGSMDSYGGITGHPTALDDAYKLGKYAINSFYESDL